MFALLCSKLCVYRKSIKAMSNLYRHPARALVKSSFEICFSKRLVNLGVTSLPHELLPCGLRPLKPKSFKLPTPTDIRTSQEVFKHPDYFNVASMFTIRDLFDNRVHLGHKIGTLTDRMAPFVFGERLGVCIFDLDKTAFHLREALNFVAHIVFRGGLALFISSNRWCLLQTEELAKQCNQFAHCRTWTDGTFTEPKKLFDNVDIRLPDVVIMTNTRESNFEFHPAITECAQMGIPTVAIVDTNCDPNLISYPIPGNDDSPSSVLYIMGLFKDVINKATEKAKQQPQLAEINTLSATFDSLPVEKLTALFPNPFV